MSITKGPYTAETVTDEQENVVGVYIAHPATECDETTICKMGDQVGGVDIEKANAEFLASSANAITTAAECMGVDPSELATAFQNGEIAELVEAFEAARYEARNANVLTHETTPENATKINAGITILTKMKGPPHDDR